LKLVFGQSKKIRSTFRPPAGGRKKKDWFQNFVLSVLRTANFRIADRTLVLDFKNAFKIAENTMPRRFAPRQLLTISQKVKLGGVF